MSWLLLAIGGHIANAVAFIIDKILLSKGFKRSATYACLISLLSVLVVVAIPWIKHWPPLSAALPIIGFGSIFVFALWSFFEALKEGEATRVVPIVGSLIPIMTLIGTMAFLHERFSLNTWVGFGCLLLATIILSGAGPAKTTLSYRATTFAVLSAILFAIASVSGKIAFSRADFLSVFVLSRLAGVLTAVFIIMGEAKARAELLSLIKPQPSKQKAGMLAVFGQVCGAFGFVMVNGALAEGSAPIVNALQAIQYGLIAVAGWFGGKTLAKLLNEDQSRSSLLIKSFAIALAALGLYFIAREVTL